MKSFLEDVKPSNSKRFYQYHGKCSNSTDKCTTLKSLINKFKFKRSKRYKKGGEKTYNKYKENVLIEKKLKTAFKRKKKYTQERRTFEEIDFSESDESA